MYRSIRTFVAASLVVLATTELQHGPIAAAGAVGGASSLTEVEDFVQTRVDQCDQLGKKTDEAFQEFATSKQYAEVQQLKEAFDAKAKKAAAEAVTHENAAEALVKIGAGLSEEYDRQIQAKAEALAAMGSLNRLYMESLRLEKNFAESRSLVLNYCLLSDRIAASKDLLDQMAKRQVQLEKQVAELQAMVNGQTDPAIKRDNEALLAQARALLAESAAKLALMQEDAMKDVAEAKRLTRESDDTSAIGAIRARAAKMRKLWNDASIRLKRAADKAREAFAHSLTATIQSSSGKVEVRRGTGQFAALKPGDMLMPGDAFRTGPDGRADLELSDGSHLHMGPKGIFEFDAEASTGGILKSGRLWLNAYIKNLREPRLKVRIPAAVAAVRGSDVVFVVEDKRVMVVVGSGEVELTPKGGGPPITVGTGQRAVFEDGRETPVIEAVKDYSQTLADLMPDM
jgi:hypothetical protein